MTFHELPIQRPSQEKIKYPEADRETNKMLELMLKQFPFLAHVKIQFVSPDDEPNTGGFFHRIKIDEHTFVPSVSIVSFDLKHMQRLIEVRKSSNQQVARLLGIDISDMTTDLLRQFIIAHEFGHATDYVRNYETNPDYYGAEAAQEWNEHYDANLFTLPVPGFDPVDLMEEIARFDNLATFFQAHPEVERIINGVEIKSLQELVEAQELAYRASAYESYADKFAVNFLKRNNNFFN